MNNCNNCDPCPPCETQIPSTCEALPTTNDARRVIVEDSVFCKKTIPEPAQISVLQHDENNDVTWRSGSLVSPIRLPSMDAHTIDNVPRILVMRADGIVKIWTPSDTGDNYIAYWDGSAWRIGNIASLLPSGSGVLTSNGTTLSFVNGANGDFLQILGGVPTFSSAIPGATPTGTIVAFAGPTAPTGWLICDGAAYGRTALAPSPQVALFGVIGTTYGAGDGLTTFNIPDLRGQFIRGFDSVGTVDPLRVYGSQQADQFRAHNHGGATSGQSQGHTHSFSGTTGDDSPDHTHTFQRSNSTGNLDLFGSGAAAYTTPLTTQNTSGANSKHQHPFSGTTSGVSQDHTHNISASGGSETRPVNVAMNYIIKT